MQFSFLRTWPDGFSDSYHPSQTTTAQGTFVATTWFSLLLSTSGCDLPCLTKTRIKCQVKKKKKKLLAETESSFHFLKSRNRSWNDHRLGRSCWSKSCSSLGGFNLSDMKMNVGSSFSSSQARSQINVKHCETVKQSTINVDILTWKVSNPERPASFRDWHHAWTSEMAIQSPSKAQVSGHPWITLDRMRLISLPLRIAPCVNVPHPPPRPPKFKFQENPKGFTNLAIWGFVQTSKTEVVFKKNMGKLDVLPCFSTIFVGSKVWKPFGCWGCSTGTPHIGSSKFMALRPRPAVGCDVGCEASPKGYDSSHTGTHVMSTPD